MDKENYELAQEQICRKYNAAFSKPDVEKIVGVADNLNDSTRPINGLRHPVTADTTGWYIWTGEYSNRKDFFRPMHLKHLIKLYPELVPYLALPPGWRFLIDLEQDYEDVWRDDLLLEE